MRVLIPGAAGAIARKLAVRLVADGHEVIGIDRRPWPDAPIEFHEVDVRKRAAEDVFRKARPEAVVHMATVTSLMVPRRGALPDQPRAGRAPSSTTPRLRRVALHLRRPPHLLRRRPRLSAVSLEDEPPLELNRFPALADLVAADLYAATALWRFPELATSVLRVCYTLGASGQGTLAGFLRGKRVPMVLGFDPLFQFLHEDDVVEALVLDARQAPARRLQRRRARSRCRCRAWPSRRGARRSPCRRSCSRASSGASASPRLPKGALTHIKYPVVVDAKAFRETTGFRHQHDEMDAIRAFREAFPRPR